MHVSFAGETINFEAEEQRYVEFACVKSVDKVDKVKGWIAAASGSKLWWSRWLPSDSWRVVSTSRRS